MNQLVLNVLVSALVGACSALIVSALQKRRRARTAEVSAELDALMAQQGLTLPSSPTELESLRRAFRPERGEVA